MKQEAQKVGADEGQQPRTEPADSAQMADPSGNRKGKSSYSSLFNQARDAKIKHFQNRLHKIRHAALWLDHITQAHTDDFKKRQKVINEVDDNVKFMQDKLVLEKSNR